MCRGLRVPATTPARFPGDGRQARQGLAMDVTLPTTQFNPLQMAAPWAAISTPPSSGAGACADFL